MFEEAQVRNAHVFGSRHALRKGRKVYTPQPSTAFSFNYQLESCD